MRGKLVLAVTVALLACVPVWALSIDGEMKVKAYRMVRLTAKGAADGSAVVWDVSDEDKCDVEEVDGRLLLVAPPGTYRVKCRSIKLSKDGKTTIETARAVIAVEGDVPPQPPIPPGPTPVPPGPTPGPAPIPVAGFRVLIVYESADLSSLPAKQLNVLYAKSVRDYMNAKCVKGEDGKTADWRLWDADVDASKDSKVWQDAMKRPRKSLPWVIVSNGKDGYEGPLPADADAMLTLLKKYAEAPAAKATKKGGRK